MKAVLLSIRPNWCKLIWSGMKTVEVRKNRPTLKTPFKVYVYCTRNGVWLMKFKNGSHKMNGKVIGEFTCSYIAPIFRYTPLNPGEPAKMYAQCADGECRKGYTDRLLQDACMNRADVEKYFDGLNGLAGYGWHISNLKIYDKPVELKKFWGIQPCNGKCCSCHRLDTETMECKGEHIGIDRAPQSWCYVEVAD